MSTHLASLVELTLRFVSNKWSFSVWALRKRKQIFIYIVQGILLVPLTFEFKKHFKNSDHVLRIVEG